MLLEVMHAICRCFQTAKGLGYQVLSYDELKAKGAASPAAPCPPVASDLCTIMYTRCDWIGWSF